MMHPISASGQPDPDILYRFGSSAYRTAISQSRSRSVDPRRARSAAQPALPPAQLNSVRCQPIAPKILAATENAF